MTQYERCTTCLEIVNFGLDNLGRVVAKCPVCHGGRKPTLTAAAREAIIKQRRNDVRYCDNEECGKEFPNDPENPKKLYCSPECRSRVYRKAGGSALQAYKESLPPRRCQGGECRQWFKPVTEFQKYCGEKCQQKEKHRRAGLVRSRLYALKKAAQRENAA